MAIDGFRLPRLAESYASVLPYAPTAKEFPAMVTGTKPKNPFANKQVNPVIVNISAESLASTSKNNPGFCSVIAQERRKVVFIAALPRISPLDATNSENYH